MLINIKGKKKKKKKKRRKEEEEGKEKAKDKPWKVHETPKPQLQCLPH
jgi:hypothetical protein